ncbi:MAG: hypothetical protein QOD99_1277, partial [Chthoniobacter sp.]|nr:hypothetical protein [Chthoniobacter sp.]
VKKRNRFNTNFGVFEIVSWVVLVIAGFLLN